MIAEPMEDFQAATARHFNIQNDDSRKWESKAIGELTPLTKIIEGLLSISDELQGVTDSGAAQCHFQKIDVIFVIFGDENGEAPVHGLDYDMV